MKKELRDLIAAGIVEQEDSGWFRLTRCTCKHIYGDGRFQDQNLTEEQAIVNGYRLLIRGIDNFNKPI